MTNITFGGYPVELILHDEEVYISCKNVTGTLTQVEKFLKDKFRTVRHYFGKSKIRHWKKGFIKIDCLEDTMENIELIYKQAKLLKNGTKT